MAPAASTSVQVALRIRPTTNQDAASIPARFQRTVIHATSSNSVSVDATNPVPATAGGAQAQQTAATAAPGKRQSFNFDQVHPPTTSQHQLYTSTARPLIERFVEGFNCTILAYGQTSSGKTYSMTGIDLDGDPSDPNNGMGIIPRSIAEIFARANALKEQRGAGWNWSIKGSFIEIYNEDLIDLLQDNSGVRREVQIREDKEGNIIWGGLREVEVRSVREVMNLIRMGSALRRTNETDMNAQSSRSHAIFSLTLTQRKFSGSGNPGRSSSPMPPVGASRIARPGSVSMQNSRVGSPTFGRPQTPSFATAMGRGGMRPGSSLGHRPATPENDGPGEWTTIVSKFHFVDLAGSERLKRTAAAGERAKEGISINGGLLALGNVISALGDPHRARAVTHVPYRDSKLTRLLQDSLGGNAHTLMIACVSPAEWNAAETINTLKYANRARNIKNRAEIREKEEGWDDIEWLQNMVTRLRKEVKAIKDGAPIPSDNATTEHAESDGVASKKVLAQVVELQENYQELRERYVERTEELTRLRRELGEQHRSSGGASGGTGKYEEIVGPVIEEYEKTISAIEAELKLNRAALRHTNELVSEKEEEFSALSERHSKTESYVEELRARIARLTEREASTESYIHDLEEKINSVDNSTANSSSVVAELRKEIARYKESDSHSVQYIAELEARLARSDESVLELRSTVETLERDAETRRNEVEFLQSRLEALKADGEGWRSELEARERRVAELEKQLLSWEERRREAGIDRERLGDLVNGVEKAKTELEENIARVREASTHDDAAAPSSALQEQLVNLQQTHTATLADLSAVSAKYRDALREISDLAEQISAAKLTESTGDDAMDSSPESTPARKRRGTVSAGRAREASDGNTTPSRRRFFRHAASSESLHGRSLSQSQSLSQELSSARSSRPPSHRSLTSPNSSISLRSPSRTASPTLGVPPVPPLLVPPLHINQSERSVESLEKEIMRLQEVLHEREAEISTLEKNLREKNGPLPRPVTPATAGFTHAVDYSPDRLRESTLSPSTMNQFDEIRRAVAPNGEVVEPADAAESLGRLDELMRSMAQKESKHREVVDDLNSQLKVLRRQHDDLTALSRDQALNMSNELEGLRDQLRASEEQQATSLSTLESLKSREAQLLAAREAAEKQYAADIAALRQKHEEALAAKAAEMDSLMARLKENETELVQFRDQLASASAALKKKQEEHEAAFGKLRADHEAEIQRRVDEAEKLLAQTKDDHERKVATLVADNSRALELRDSEAAESVTRLQVAHEEVLRKLRAEHSDAISRLEADSLSQQERLRKEHTAELQRVEAAREGLLSDSHESQLQAMRSLEEAHTTAVREKEASFAQDLEKLKAEHARVLSAKADDHVASLEQLKSEHAASLAKVESARTEDARRLAATLDDAREEHGAAIAKLKAEAEESLQNAKRQHASILEEFTRDHEASTAALRSDHSSALASLKAVHGQNLTAAEERRIKEQDALKVAHEAELASFSVRLSDEKLALKKSSATKEQELDAQHAAAVEELLLSQQSKLAGLQQQHAEQVASLRDEHQSALSAAESAVAAAQSRHAAALEEARNLSDRLLAEEREHQVQMLAELDDIHGRERSTLNKDIKLLQQENSKLVEELAKAQRVAESTTSTHDQKISAQESLLRDKNSHIATLESDLASVRQEHAGFAAEIAKLQEELQLHRADQVKQEALGREALDLRAQLAEVRGDLQRFKNDVDVLQAEKARQDVLVKELQAQVATQANARASPPIEARSPSIVRPNASSSRLPPLTPPPSVPPPPVPTDLPPLPVDRQPTRSTLARSSDSSRGSVPDSPGGTVSTAPSSLPSTLNGQPADIKFLAQLEEKDQTIEEQETMIRTLNKQLTHCEGDLQAHMDLVATLETSLSDSERNLRKARMQATELAKERDSLKTQVDSLRSEIQESKAEMATMRRSVVEEKLTLENRLDEERRAKERARAQLDSRMEELQRRKSKFICM